MSMKINRATTLAFWLAVWLAAACGSKQQAPVNTLRVGVSVASVNPPIGAYIAGDKQNRKFTGVHDSLYTRAIVVHNDTASVAIVTIDCIGLLYTDVLRIRQQVAAITNFPAERLVVSSTHTHSGPDVVGIWGSDYQHTGVDSAYMKFLVETAARQVKLAHEQAQPAVALAAETVFGEGWVENICNEEIDRAVSILHFRSEAGQPLATLTNFACHPTYLDASYSEVSADYVGGYYREMEKLGLGTSLFLQGAIGGWVQPVDGEGTFEKADQRGRGLAAAVAEALAKADTLEQTAIRFASARLLLPVENEGWKQLSAIGTIPRAIGDSVQTEVSWFSIGPAQFATHPGETAPYFGLETKRMMTTGPRFVLGLGNDALGYILKPTFFEHDSIPHAAYLTSMSVGKPTGPLMMDKLREMIEPQQQR